MANAKQELRRAVIERRDAIDPRARKSKSAQVCDALMARLGTCMVHKPVVAVYSAMNSEVDLREFIAGAYSLGCTLAFPVMINVIDGQGLSGQQHTEMRFCRITERQWQQGVSFLRHPLQTFAPDAIELMPFPMITARQMEFVVVPLVAFDAAGNRLGYGGGNYDRFLPNVPDNAQVYGAAFTEQQVEEVPTNRFDQRIDVIAR